MSVGDIERAEGDELAAALDIPEPHALALAPEWCPACGEMLVLGVCPRAGTPGHLDEHGYTLR